MYVMTGVLHLYILYSLVGILLTTLDCNGTNTFPRADLTSFHKNICRQLTALPVNQVPKRLPNLPKLPKRPESFSKKVGNVAMALLLVKTIHSHELLTSHWSIRT